MATYPIMVDKRLLQISPDKLQEKSHFYGAVIIFKIRKLGGADSKEMSKDVIPPNFSQVFL